MIIKINDWSCYANRYSTTDISGCYDSAFEEILVSFSSPETKGCWMSKMIWASLGLWPY